MGVVNTRLNSWKATQKPKVDEMCTGKKFVFATPLLKAMQKGDDGVGFE